MEHIRIAIQMIYLVQKFAYFLLLSIYLQVPSKIINFINGKNRDSFRKGTKLLSK